MPIELAINSPEPQRAITKKQPEKAMANVPRMDVIDERIRKGEFSQYDPVTGIGSPEKDYVQCNQFVDNVAQQYWGVKLPRMKHQIYNVAAAIDPKTGKIGNPEDWSENPMSAANLEPYMRERSKLIKSGVYPVSPSEASKLANKGELVLVLGGDHATIAAPNKDPWPLVYRSDLAFRHTFSGPIDHRTRVGIKNFGGKGLSFYKINPNEYKKFNAFLKSNGLSDTDVYGRWNPKTQGPSEGYKQLHLNLRKRDNNG